MLTGIPKSLYSKLSGLAIIFRFYSKFTHFDLERERVKQVNYLYIIIIIESIVPF